MEPSHSISVGVKEDLRILLDGTVELFDKYCELRFSNFVQIWQKMQFGLIFCGRTSFRELYEFSEDVLEITRDYLVSEDESFGCKAAAMYALYSLNAKQPCRPKVTVRLTLSHVREIKDFLTQCRDGAHWDVIYCWVKLVKEKAFTYSAEPSIMGLEIATQAEMKRNFEKLSELNDLAFNPFKTEEFVELSDRLSHIHQQYTDLKAGLRGGLPSTSDKALSLINEKFPEQINDIVDTAYHVVVEGDPDMAHSPEKQSTDNIIIQPRSEIGSRRQKLREKYFSLNSESSRQKEIKNFEEADIAEKISDRETEDNAFDRNFQLIQSSDIETSPSSSPPKKNKAGGKK